MTKPTYNLLEISRILKTCEKDKNGLICLVDIVIEDDQLYTEQEIDLITDMINDVAKGFIDLN